MNDDSFIIDVPSENCKTTQNERQYFKNGFNVVLTERAEERHLGSDVVLESERTKVQRSKNFFSILKVSVVVENGVKSKYSEYASYKIANGILAEKRCKRTITNGKTVFYAKESICEDYQIYWRTAENCVETRRKH